MDYINADYINAAISIVLIAIAFLLIGGIAIAIKRIFSKDKEDIYSSR